MDVICCHLYDNYKSDLQTARMTRKSNLRSFKRNGATKNLFDCDFTDEEGSSIQATFFDSTADNYFDRLHENHVRTKLRFKDTHFYLIGKLIHL